MRFKIGTVADHDLTRLDERDKTYHSGKDNVVDRIGNMAGIEPWQNAGNVERDREEAEYDEERTDRLGGHKDTVVGAVTGDRESKRAGERESERT
jgi:hypothetical protein